MRSASSSCSSCRRRASTSSCSRRVALSAPRSSSSDAARAARSSSRAASAASRSADCCYLCLRVLGEGGERVSFRGQGLLGRSDPLLALRERRLVALDPGLEVAHDLELLQLALRERRLVALDPGLEVAHRLELLPLAFRELLLAGGQGGRRRLGLLRLCVVPLVQRRGLRHELRLAPVDLPLAAFHLPARALELSLCGGGRLHSLLGARRRSASARPATSQPPAPRAR